VVEYHGLRSSPPVTRGFLMRPQLNSGTLGGRHERANAPPSCCARPMTPDKKVCQATPSWRISVPTDFVEIQNGDSWQSHADTRVVYVSSMKVGNRSAPALAATLLATAARGLAPPSEVERYRFEEAGVVGEAQIAQTADGFELKGVACVDGNVATCVINFERRDQQDWAISTWRSLQGATPRPWWRVW
jgi:hypothetical protein